MPKIASRIDRQLRQELERPGLDAVEAVVALRLPLGKNPEAAITQRVVREVLDRVSRKCGEAPARVQVFGELGRFAISAPRSFISSLVEQPEIDSARSNALPDIAFHPKKRPA